MIHRNSYGKMALLHCISPQIIVTKLKIQSSKGQ